MDGIAEQGLVENLARLVVGAAAPEELVLFDDTANEYFADPAAALRPAGGDVAVGFGLELAMVTPVVLAVVTPVVKFLLAVAGEAAKDEAKPILQRWVHRLFRRTDATDATDATDEGRASPQPLTREQAQRVRLIAETEALRLQVPADKAALLADAVVGQIWVSA